MKTRRSTGRIFRWPAVVAVLTLAGLMSALVGDDGWDVLSWVLLALPVGLGIGFGLRPGQP